MLLVFLMKLLIIHYRISMKISNYSKFSNSSICENSVIKKYLITQIMKIATIRKCRMVQKRYHRTLSKIKFTANTAFRLFSAFFPINPQNPLQK